MGRVAPAYYVQDGVIPRTRLSEVLRQIDALAAEYRLQVANVFHAGDGNLHPLVCYDAAVEGEPARAEKLAGLIIRACVDAGGSITGEHGVGIDKKAYMPAMFSEADLEAFQRLRCAFDPHGLANPGKVMPTPRLCGEVPGPYRRASARARRDRGAVLDRWPASLNRRRPSWPPRRSPKRLASATRFGSWARPPSVAGVSPPRRRTSSCAAPRLTRSSSTTPAT